MTELTPKQRWYEANKERIREKSRQRYLAIQADPILKAIDDAKKKANYEKNREKILTRKREDYHATHKHDPEWVTKNKQWHKDNVEQSRGHKLTWELRNPEYIMWLSAKKRAEKSGIPFEITREDILIPPTCPILGIELKRATGQLTPNSPSLDRKNSSLGYVKENIAVISMRANRIKSDATLEEIRSILNYMES